MVKIAYLVMSNRDGEDKPEVVYVDRVLAEAFMKAREAEEGGRWWTWSLHLVED